jgi:hypothetical protein
MAFGDFATLADVRTWLQTGPQPYPSTDDALLVRLISAASQFVASWLNRPIVPGDWQELRDGPGSFGWETSFVFGVQPVSAVLLVAVDNYIIPPAPAVPPTPIGQPQLAFPTVFGYVFTPTALTIRGYPVPRKKACVLLQYTAGFATVPLDIAQATIELVCRKYHERTRIGERSKSLLGGETTAYETVSFSLRDMHSDIQVLLEQYRTVTPIFGAVPMPAPDQFDPATLVAAL